MLASTVALLVAAPAAYQPFVTPVVVEQPERLAITPLHDGRIDPEEWDQLCELDGGEAYFQWEPQVLHVASKLPLGQDLLISCDMNADGWLHGKDNLEIRVRFNNGTPDVQTRLLDGTPVSGPEWKEATAFQASAKTAASTDGTTWTLEMSLVDPGKLMLAKEPDHRMGIRLDPVPDVEGAHEPFLPRIMTNVKLKLDRAEGLPEGVGFKPEYKGREVVPGEKTRIRLTFNNGKPDMDIRRIEVRTEGFARDVTGMTGLPFPKFDSKGRAFIDYETVVEEDATPGYRVLRATVVDSEGNESVAQSSFEVAPSVEFELVPPSGLSHAMNAQKTKLVVYVKSNTRKRVDGIIRVEGPSGWNVVTGTDEPFIIYNAKGRIRRVFEVEVPADVQGPYPIKVQAHIGTKLVEETLWLTIR